MTFLSNGYKTLRKHSISKRCFPVFAHDTWPWPLPRTIERSVPFESVYAPLAFFLLGGQAQIDSFLAGHFRSVVRPLSKG